MRENRLVAVVLTFFLLLFSLPSLNSQIAANAQSENATVMDKFAGTVLPLFLSTMVVAFGGGTVYLIVKDMR